MITLSGLVADTFRKPVRYLKCRYGNTRYFIGSGDFFDKKNWYMEKIPTYKDYLVFEGTDGMDTGKDGVFLRGLTITGDRCIRWRDGKNCPIRASL
jgi:hypothetical protein